MNRAGSVAAIILAAGASSRMGTLKPLMKLAASTILQEAASRFRAAGVPDVLVVVGFQADVLIPIVANIRARWIHNESFRDGMLSSVLKGIAALDENVEAFFLLPVDTPLVKPQTIARLLQEYQQSKAPVIYPLFRGTRGHPPLIATHCVAGLLPDQEGGLQAYLRKFDTEARELPTVDEGIVLSCNIPEEYHVVAAHAERNGLPTINECKALWEQHNVLDKTITHCRIVAEFGRLMAIHLNCAGHRLNAEAVSAAGMVHDIAKGQRNHAGIGAEILRDAGFDRIADIVATHMDIVLRSEDIDESQVLYLADKCVCGADFISLEKRLEQSLRRFADQPEALSSATKRLQTARVIQERVERCLGMSLTALIERHKRGIRIAEGKRIIYLVRHGCLDVADGRKRYIGQIDIPLNDKGIRQAAALRERLRNVSFTAVYCSDLSRARDTAAIVAQPHGLQPIERVDLREIALGAWEGITFDEIRRHSPQEYGERGRDIVLFRPPGGESFSDCNARVIAALFNILSTSEGDLLLVAHAGVNRLLLGLALGTRMDDLLAIPQEYGCLNIIRYEDFSFQLELLNESVLKKTTD
ncbi:MAG TPA: alpha-ribazole phosphatase [Dissulfurispiraceae bacterium]|nr:alpha-ribazole phosphatase [Dissulfurispiraceae bacterium]